MSNRFSWSEWRVLVLVWLVYFNFGFHMASLVPFVLDLRRELGLSYSQMGFILGVWQITYIVGAGAINHLAERLSIKNALLAGLAFIALSAFARIFASDFFSLAAAVILFGVGGPIISVGIPHLLSEWFQGKKLGFASGLYMTGAASGSAAAIALLGGVGALLGGWREAFGVAATLVLISAES